ncbi:hypothetical protein NE237_029154 [Protea cynaroides]|uniref:HTH myb-type domain-containing protein n=1 Tax=Protea cynaroides TaxID=273540 RepID=A0A9Q0JUT6_9MAGN|nr:hypothetical protein NE237_029154 [Protea cynaroides]
MAFDQAGCHGNSNSLGSGSGDSNQHKNDHQHAPYSQPRVRWNETLHRRFISVVRVLGGVEKAKPKAIIERMHVDGLTTNHVKSHLQKYKKDLKLGKQLRPRTAAASQHFGVSTYANGETANMNRDNPTPPIYLGAGTSTHTGETSNINNFQFQSTCPSLQVGGGTTSQYQEATDTNGNTGTTPSFHQGAGILFWNRESYMDMIRAAASPHLRPSTFPGEEASGMKRMKVASLHPGADTAAPNMETLNMRRINATAPLHLSSRASMLNGEIPIRATASPPHPGTGTSTGNVLPSNIIGQRNFNEAEAAMRAQLEEQMMYLFQQGYAAGRSSLGRNLA